MRRLDGWILAPVLLGLLCFVPRALPTPAVASPSRARSVALPQLQRAPERARERRFELDLERSSMRLLVVHDGGSVLVACSAGRGELLLGPADQDGALSLELDLSSLQVVEASAGGPRLDDVLAVLGEPRLTLRAQRLGVASGDLPRVWQDRWRGTVGLGASVVSRPLSSWRCALPGRRLRTQTWFALAGVDAAGGDADRGGIDPGGTVGPWLQNLDPRYAVTIGLDLAWRRSRGNGGRGN